MCFFSLNTHIVKYCFPSWKHICIQFDIYTNVAYINTYNVKKFLMHDRPTLNVFQVLYNIFLAIGFPSVMVLGSGDFGRWSGCKGGALGNGLCCCCSVAKSCLTLCDPVDYSMPGSPVLHYLQEFAKIHVRWVGDHPLLPPSVYAYNLSHQGLFQ